jgi:tRNA-specific 2-thiouridylase
MSHERAEAFAEHLYHPRARGHVPAGAFTGAAGGGACGDLVRISLALDPAHPRAAIADAGFDAHGCGAAIAAGSAAVALVRGTPLLHAARVSAAEIAAELGGLTAGKRHAAELAADALHRALGAAARGSVRLEAVPGRVLVAMSGGVDSAVAALLCGEAGAEVVGVTLELWADAENDGERSCCSAQAVRGARAVAHALGAPHLSIDLREEFRAGVVEPWLSDHARGLTPNPCIRCNGSVRLDAMLELAERLGAGALATGHYARLEHGPASRPGASGAGPERDAAPLLRAAADAGKDQSYALAALSPASLARLRFPLGDLTKQRVRELAARAGLAVAGRRDSQDLCFLAGTARGRFIARHAASPPRPGPIVDRAGAVLGRHDGHQGFTVGQRHGLRLGGPGPYFVLGTDAAANTVVVGPRRALLTRSVPIADVTLRRPGACVDGVKLRSRGGRLACRLRAPAGGAAAAAPGEGRHGRLVVELAEPAERTAPGQLACLYEGEAVVGHGTIAAEERVRAGSGGRAERAPRRPADAAAAARTPAAAGVGSGADAQAGNGAEALAATAGGAGPAT